MRYKNGNAVVSLDLRDGTRIIEYPDNDGLTLNTPLNIDIRVSTQCPYGYNKYTKQSTCAFCHESALVDGKECDYGVLQQVLMDAKLPRGTEIALGVNEVTDNLIKFVKNLWQHGLVVNITMNERYIAEFGDTRLLKLKPYIFGLGISYRSLQGCLSLPDWIADYTHTVIHVINGDVREHPFYTQIEEWLDKLGIEFHKVWCYDFSANGYIDHQSEYIINPSLFKTKQDLITYLFNDDLIIHIENDNEESQAWYTGEKHDDF